MKSGLIGRRTPPDEAPGLRAYFAKVCSNAWHGGLEFLADTVAVLLSILIGGIVWWVLLAITIIVIRRKLRRGARAD